MGFDIPDPPPDVRVTFQNNQSGYMILTWNDEADTARDPDYSGDEALDVRGYRVYRSRPPSFDWHYGPWEFVKEIPLKMKIIITLLQKNTHLLIKNLLLVITITIMFAPMIADIVIG
jgi:hypothetical protein